MELLPNTVQMRAGVVNIILKKTNYTEVSLTSGVTSKEMVSTLVLILTRGLKSLTKVL
jgi:hypothetical protein